MLTQAEPQHGVDGGGRSTYEPYEPARDEPLHGRSPWRRDQPQ